MDEALAKEAIARAGNEAETGGGARCLRGCLIGCGTTAALCALVTMAFLAWLFIPYEGTPMRAFLRPEHTAVFRIGYSQRMALAALDMFDDFQKIMARDRYRALDPVAREVAVAAKLARWRQQRDQIEQVIRALKDGGDSENAPIMLSSATAGDERLVLVAFFHGLGKKAQLFYRFMVAFLPSRVLTRVDEAIVIRGPERGEGASGTKLEAVEPLAALAPGVFGLTVFRGHLLAGSIEPGLRLAVDAVAGRGAPERESFVARNWPSGAGSVLAAAIDNRRGSLRRMLVTLLELARRMGRKDAPPKEATAAAPAAEDALPSAGPAATPENPSPGALAAAAQKEGSISPEWDRAFAGAVVHLKVEGPRTLNLEADLHPRGALEGEQVRALVEETARVIGEAAGISLSVSAVERRGKAFRVVVTTGKLDALWSQVKAALEEKLEQEHRKKLRKDFGTQEDAR